MDAVEREGLKEQLRAMAAGRGDGIDLDSPERWVIEDLKNSVSFFRHLDRLIPSGSVLYFEGCGILPDVARFYEANRASNVVCVVWDTIFPIPETFHVPMTPEVVEGIIGMLGHHHLAAWVGQPVGPANDSQPIRSETRDKWNVIGGWLPSMIVLLAR